MPELPSGDPPAAADRAQGLSAYDADVIVNQGREVVDYFLAAARTGSGDAKQAANWVTQHVLRVMNADGEVARSEVGLPGRAPRRHDRETHRPATCPVARSREVFDLMIEDDSDADAAMAQARHRSGR